MRPVAKCGATQQYNHLLQLRMQTVEGFLAFVLMIADFIISQDAILKITIIKVAIGFTQKIIIISLCQKSNKFIYNRIIKVFYTDFVKVNSDMKT